MKAKKCAMLSIILLSIMISACGLNRSSTVNDGSDSFTSDRITGTQGLELKFVENMPPREVWIGNPFQVGIELRNKGTAQVTTGFTSLHSVKANMWTITPAIAKLEINEPIKGRTTFDSEGGYLFEIFNVQSSGEIGDLKDNFFYDEFNLVACYGYKTVASQEICVGPTIVQNPLDKDNLCEPSKVYSLGSQGAPVAVSKVERFTVTQKGDGGKLEYYPYFTFEIQNAGKGNVRTTASDCVDPDEITVNDTKVTFSGESSKDRVITNPGPGANTNKPASIRCDEVPLTEIEKRSILKKITCRSEKALDISRGKYTTPLIIEVNYGYRDSNTVKVKVNRNVADSRCNGKNAGDDCGDNQKCSTEGRCVPKCDYYHTNEEGWKCRSVGECDLNTTCDADAWCKVGYCPLGDDNVCCNPGKKGFSGDDECFGQNDGYACASYKVCKSGECIEKCRYDHFGQYNATGGTWFCRTKTECGIQEFSDCDTLDKCEAGKCPGADVCCIV